MKSSADIEAEVEASRDELDRNVEALKQKMTPGQLFDEAARMMGGTGQQVASKFAEQAKANPMPLAVMGLGLGWLMVSNNKAQSSGGYAEPRSFRGDAAGSSGDAEGGGLGERVHDRVQDLGDRAGGLLDEVKDKVAGVRASAAEGGRSAMAGVGSAASDVRERAGQTMRQAQQALSDTLASEPLLLAGLGLLVGAAIGAALPGTEAEDRLLGETRDRMMAKGKDMAQAGLDKAGDAARETYQAVKSELGEGDDGRPSAERIAEAARSGARAAKDELQGPTH